MTASPLAYLLYDVFADAPFAGNQLAVFPDGGRLDDATMQAVARELNLAESVFMHRTGDDGRPAELRIFTPGREVPFAGHPTIGTAVAVARELQWTAGERFALGERIGDVALRIERTGGDVRAWLMTPSVAFGETFAPDGWARALGLARDRLRDDIAPCIASAGTPFAFVALRDPESVDAAVLDVARFRDAIGDPARVVGTFVFAQTGDGTYARMFAPLAGIAEDPATGSATGPLYALLVRSGALEVRDRASFTAMQGVRMQRASRIGVNITMADGVPQIEIGGTARHVGRGELFLSES